MTDAGNSATFDGMYKITYYKLDSYGLHPYTYKLDNGKFNLGSSNWHGTQEDLTWSFDYGGHETIAITPMGVKFRYADLQQTSSYQSDASGFDDESFDSLFDEEALEEALDELLDSMVASTPESNMDR